MRYTRTVLATCCIAVSLSPAAWAQGTMVLRLRPVPQRGAGQRVTILEFGGGFSQSNEVDGQATPRPSAGIPGCPITVGKTTLRIN
jgi:hypothetical protein